ncbi:MAG TPA: TetR/AcrR family transcriptional regulator C-terminal domain-containing protein [Actinoplanes sp.]|nr:TetR/AcrR family transcriptional regulator C-terminal domain-containing protein [Actinoplanes sp.]
MDSVWTRTQPPPRDKVTRAQIVRAAVDLLDDEGLAGLTMRKLGGKLSVAATTLYWHVQTKDDLLEYAVDAVYAEIDVPGPELAGWRGAATLLAHSMRSTIIRHPWLPAVINQRISVGPNAMALSSRGMAIFSAAGFTGRDPEKTLAALISYVLGSAGSEVAWRTMVKASGKSAPEWTDEALAQALPAAEAFPDVRDVLEQRGRRNPYTMLDETFTFGLEALLDGFAARLPGTWT